MLLPHFSEALNCWSLCFCLFSLAIVVLLGSRPVELLSGYHHLIGFQHGTTLTSLENLTHSLCVYNPFEDCSVAFTDKSLRNFAFMFMRNICSFVFSCTLALISGYTSFIE